MTVPTLRGRTALTGGGTGALDAIDGAKLAEGDPVLVFRASDYILLPYMLDSDSAATESSPDVISPDKNAGNKRHVLAGLRAKSVQATDGYIFNAAVPADHTYSGFVWTGTAGENLAIGDVCYLKSDGKFWKADADAEATTAGLIVMATASISADASGVFLRKGFIRDDSWAWTVGAELFVSTTPGNPTATKPSGTGDVVRIVGYAYTADIIWFEPDTAYAEVA